LVNRCKDGVSGDHLRASWLLANHLVLRVALFELGAFCQLLSYHDGRRAALREVVH
jgi:hypothetical protein